MPLPPRFVEQVATLDVRELVRKGLLDAGVPTRHSERVFNAAGWQFLELKIIVGSASGLIDVFSDQRRVQTIRLVRKTNRSGKSSWNFDWQGRLLRKLYFSGSTYGPRDEKRLSYAKQVESKLDRQRRWIDEGPKVASGSYEPVTTLHRLKTAEGLATLSDALETSYLARSSAPTLNARKRRASFEERVSQYREVLARGGRESTVHSSEQNLALVEEAQAIAPRSAPVVNGHFQDDKLRQKPSKSFIELPVLRRLGAVKSGELSQFPLSWPKDWLPEPDRRVDCLIDLRAGRRPCCAFIIVDPGKVSVQFFDLILATGDFGKSDWRFQDAKNGRISKSVIYHGGTFVLPGPVRRAKRG
jgi:hypothetical protein